MPLKSQLSQEELGQLPEPIKEHYKPIEGKQGAYILDVSAVGGIELRDTSALQKALQQERANREAFEKALKPYEGVDPDKAKEALAKLDEIASWDPDKKLAEAKTIFEKQLTEKFEGERKSREKSWQDKLSSAQSRADHLTEQLRSALIDTELTQAIAAEGGNVKWLFLPLKQQLVMKEVDGKFVVRVVNDEGLERMSPRANSNDFMTARELAAERKNDPDWQAAYAGRGVSGLGGTSNLGGDGVSDISGVGGFLKVSKAAVSDSDGTINMQKYNAFREQALKKGLALKVE